MKRMVVIANSVRGVVEPHEPLNAEIEAIMFEREFVEAESRGAHVYWRTGDRKLPPRNYQPRAKVDALMALAEKLR